MFIPDPNFFHPGFRIRVRFKELSILNPKNCFQTLGKMIRDVHPRSGSRIRNLIFLLIPDPGSRGQKGTGSRIRIRNNGTYPKIIEENIGCVVFGRPNQGLTC
jgi:hypothetical protein